MFTLFEKLIRPRKETVRLFFESDIHCHILPGIDDGAISMEDSILLVHGMMELGLKRAVCTPHTIQDVYPNTPQTILSATEMLQSTLSQLDLQFELYASSEYRLEPTFETNLVEGKLLLLPENHILIENPFTHEYPMIRNVVRQLLDCGYSPILAHPERYHFYHMNYNCYRELQESGVKFQVNLLSFSGYYGKEVRSVSEELLEKGFIQFIGTDIHHTTHLEHLREYLRTAHYKRIAEQLFVQNDMLFE